MAGKRTGRPSGFKPEFCQQAADLCTRGATDADLAEFFKVSTRTIYRWQIEFPDFCQALKVAKEVADERVIRSLYHKAVGYTHEAVKIFMPAGAKKPVYATYTEHVPPDSTAAIFWLKNRKPELWRDRQQHEHTGKDGGPIQTLDLSKATDEQLTALEAVFGPLAAADLGNGGDTDGKGETSH